MEMLGFSDPLRELEWSMNNQGFDENRYGFFCRFSLFLPALPFFATYPPTRRKHDTIIFSEGFTSIVRFSDRLLVNFCNKTANFWSLRQKLSRIEYSNAIIVNILQMGQEIIHIPGALHIQDTGN